MTTDNSYPTTHTHVQSRTSGGKTGSGGLHAHGTSAVDALIVALTARVTALEALGAGPAGPQGIPGPQGPTGPAGGVYVPPPPPALTRPFPAPVTSRTVTLPPSIDVAGTTEVSAALNAFITSVPDGSIIDFGAAVAIRLAQGIQFAKRSNLVLQLRTVRLVADPATPAIGPYTWSPICLGHTYGGFWDNGNTDIAIYGGVVVGNNPKPGIWPSPGEAQHSLALIGTTRLEVAGLTGQGAPGDFAFFESVTDGWLHDCHGIDAGRNGVSVISGNRITVERTPLDKSGYVTFDIEPNPGQPDGCVGITWRAGTAKCGSDAFFALDGSNAGVPISDITVDGITTDALHTIAGFTGAATTRPQRVTFTNNVASGASNNGLTFQHIDGLTVKGNTTAGVPFVPVPVDCTLA